MLPTHGFQYRTLSGDMSMQKRAKALRDFQKDPPTTIFLLSMRAGSVGINLTQANRVFILEPCLNPALEMQAIGRVYRLGQKRKVEVTRFVVNNTIETKIVETVAIKHGRVQQADSNIAAKSDDIIGDQAVGYVNSDKAALVEEEYDWLFGVSDAKSSIEESKANGNGTSEITNGDGTELRDL